MVQVPFVVHGYEMKQAHINNSSHLLATKLPNVLKHLLTQCYIVKIQ
jgi:hypothetical protein